MATKTGSRPATRIAALAALALEALTDGDFKTVEANLKEIAHRAIDIDARTGRPDPSKRSKGSKRHG